MTPATPQASETCEVAFRSIVLACADMINASLAVFLDSDDPSGPHKARVALRRLTTSLDAFQPILRRRPVAGLRAHAKLIFRDLGEVRDSDVQLARAHSRRDIKIRTAQNRALREKARKRLKKRSVIGFPNDLRTQTAQGGPIYRRSAKGAARRNSPAGSFARDVLDEAWQRCLAYGGSVRTIPEASRHEFRKDMKSLRYLAEFFAELSPGSRQDCVRADLRDIQDALGTLNDFHVGLRLEGRKRPRVLPESELRALDRAEELWARLAAAYPMPSPTGDDLQATLCP